MTKPNRRFLTGTPRRRTNLNIPAISLMWPGKVPNASFNTASWESDMGLDDLIQALALDRSYQPFVRKSLNALVTDTEVIAWRQAVTADFLNNPQLVDAAHKILPRLTQMRQGTNLLGTRQRNLLLDTADHLAELDSYVTIIQVLYDALSASNLESQALIQLRDHLAVLLADEDFRTLQHDLPEMRAPIENIRSLTIGINLDVELRPYSATLMAINDHQVGESNSILNRLIGIRTDDSDEGGIAPLHYTPKDPNQRPLSPLFQDLDRILTQVAQPVAQALSRYIKVGSANIANLENELAFYVGEARLFQQVANAGIAVCRPEIVPIETRLTHIADLTNIALCIKPKGQPVPSDADFGENGRIGILTGPNNGGKTTYLRSVGLAQVMFQAGLFIAAKSAQMSPVDTIATHFPVAESRQEGRLAEEAARLHRLFQHISAASLVLLNETFSSTSSDEAFYLARDIICGLRVIGVRAIYATHLTQLAENLPEISAHVEGASELFSLVAGIQLTGDGQVAPTYRIERGLPLGRSYAQEIARHHGISLEQILQGRSNGSAKTT